MLRSRAPPAPNAPSEIPSSVRAADLPTFAARRRLLGFLVCAALLFALGVAVDQLVMMFYLAMAVCIFFLVSSPFRCANCGHRW